MQISIEKPSIVFPRDGATFDEGSPIALSAKGKGTGTWRSSKDGLLGSGENIAVELSAGEHAIVYEDASSDSEPLHLTVREATFVHGQFKSANLSLKAAKLVLAPGNYLPVFVSVGSSTISIESVMQNARAMGPASPQAQKAAGTHLSELRPQVPVASFALPAHLASPQRGGRAKDSGNRPDPRSLFHSQAAKPSIGDTHVFRVANVASGTMSEPNEVTTELLRIIGNIELWVDVAATIGDTEWSEFIDAVTRQVLPRATAILSPPIEPDDDGTIRIVITGLLNKDRLAIGFFNPCDYFALDTDPSSAEYNPTSNQDDILYVGIPVNTPGDAYSVKSIAATVGHEYQHLVRFSRKTYRQFLSGIENPGKEDSAFDEGMSHLMENLCGLGLSGGNLRFFNRWLSAPEKYSIRYDDADGSSDSAGKRGGTAAFFYWLFEKAGGAQFLDDSSASVVDSGGIAFIRRTIEDPRDGWSVLEDYFHQSSGSLFSSYILDLNSAIGAPSLIFDPFTGEPISIRPASGSFHDSAGNSISIGPVTRIDMGQRIEVPGFGAAFLNPLSFSNKTIVTFELTNAVFTGEGGASFWMQ